MKLRAALLLCACMVLCSCESSTVTSQVKQDGTSSETTASQAITTAEESVRKITVPTTFTDGVNGRIYVEIVRDESGEPVKRLTKYLEIDGIMYKDTGMGSRGSAGVFAYSQISAMSDNEIIFTYPIRQDLTDELILTGIAEGRLVQEDGTWKFGWYLGEDNVTDKYNDIWYA